MATLRDIRRRISAVNNTAKITQAMKMVSTAKLKRAQDAILAARPFAAKLGDILMNLVDSIGESYSHPLLEKRKNIKNIAVVVIAGDRGLCGSFNTAIFRATNRLINEELKTEYPNAKIHFIPLGKKAASSFKNSNATLLKSFPQIFQGLKFENAKEITDYLTAEFTEGRIDKVMISFNMFKNLLVQIPSTICLLPLEQHVSDANKTKFNIDYIYEPNQKEILDDLLPRHIDIQLWRTLLESNAAEQASRRMAMENATKNAKDLVQYLELVFNKERQATITREMLEIVGGANAQKG
jgi:F-type H+-transporting ATPase subunit gamma